MSCRLRLLRASLLGVALFGTACSDLPLGVYRVDVQQGNVLTEEMLAQLTPGMEKRKVRFLLGTPMLVDTFNQDRWDYIYTYAKGGKEIEQLQVTLFFEDERLARIEGDVHRGDGTRKAMPGESLVLVPEEQRSKGFLDVLRPRFDFLGGDDADTDSPEPAAAAGQTGDELNEETSGAPQPAALASGAEEIESSNLDSSTEPSEAPQSAETDDDGWFGNLLQYLEDTVPTFQGNEPEPSSLPGPAPDRQ